MRFMGNPSQMKKLLSQLNIKQTPIDAKRVVIETDGGKIIISNPSVVKVEMQGNTFYQISGEETKEAFSEEDITLVAEQAGVSKEEAIEALKKADGKVAEAIMFLEEQKANNGGD